MVALDVGGAGAAAGLDDVRVEGALDQELDRVAVAGAASATTSRAAASKTRMNSRPMILRFCSGSVTPASASRSRSGGVDDLEPDPRRCHEVGLDLLGLALAQQSVVDEDAGEVVADGPVHERGGHRGVEPAREPADARLVADLRADRRDLLVDDVRRRPGRREARDGVQEVLEHRLPERRVHHLRMELQAREARARRPRSRPATSAVEAVTVKPAGPRGRRRRATSTPAAPPGAPSKSVPRAGDRKRGAAELARGPCARPRRRGRRHRLEAVADAQDRDAGPEERRGRWRARRPRTRSDGPPDRIIADGFFGEHLGGRHGRRDDLAVDPRLAHAARDELGVLRAEVDDQDQVVFDGGCHGQSLDRAARFSPSPGSPGFDTLAALARWLSPEERQRRRCRNHPQVRL